MISGAIDIVKKFASAMVIKDGVEAFKSLVSNAAAMGDAIDKNSQALGMSRQAYQEWDYILSQNGSSIESLGVSMKTLNNAIVDGSKTGVAAFEALGLSIDDLRTIDMEAQFETVVRAFQNMEAGSEKAALAVDLFGRNGMALLPLLNNTGTSIDELRAKAEELGIIMGDESVNASVRYTDSMDTLNRTVNALKNEIGAALIPKITEFVELATDSAGKIVNAYREDGFTGAIKAAGELIENSIKSAYDSILNINWVGLGESIRSAIENAIKAISENITGFFETAWADIQAIDWTGLGDAIRGFISTAVDKIVGWFTDTFTNIKSSVENIDWKATGDSIRTFIENAVSSISGWFSELFSGIINDLQSMDWKALGDAIVELIKSGLAALDQVFSGLFGAGWDTLKQAINDLTPILAGVGAAIVVVTTAITAMKAAMAITDFLHNVGSSFQALFNIVTTHPFITIAAAIAALVTLFITAYQTNDEFREKVDTAWETIKSVAETVFSAVQSAIETAINAIVGAWNAVKDFFTVTIPKVWNSFLQGANAVFDPIKAVIEGAIGIISTVWNSVASFFTTTIPDAWNTLKEKADSLLAPIKGIIDGVASAVEGFVGWWSTLLGLDSNKSFSTTYYENYEYTYTNATEKLENGLAAGDKGAAAEYLLEMGISNARSMSGGTILRGATMFGWDAQGRPQIGGGEGDEAVVGLTSLNQQIRQAVSDGLSGVMAGLESALSGSERPVYVVLDTGELVGAIGSKMDKEFTRMGDWTGGGRA